MSRIAAAALLLGCLLGAQAGSAQSRRPLVTEDVETLESGRAELTLGLQLDDAFLSPSQPLEGSLFRAPVVGFAVGLGSRVEMQLFMPLYQYFNPDGASSRSSVGDLVLATKLRILGGRGAGPGLGFRWRVKLPNASDEEGIGTDQTDFNAELLAGLDLGKIELHAAVGLAILGDPLSLASQDDQLSFGLGLEYPGDWGTATLEVEGLAGPGRPDVTQLRSGLRLGLGFIDFDGSLGYRWTGGLSGPILCVGVTLPFRLFPG